MALRQHEKGKNIIFSYPLLFVSGLHLNSTVYKKFIYSCGKDGTKRSYEGLYNLLQSQLFDIDREKHQGREDGESGAAYNLFAD